MTDIKLIKEKLQTELELLEKELKTIGRKNPDNPSDWETIPPKMEVSSSDENEVADTMEEFESNSAVLKQLEIRYNEIKSALDRVENGAFGKCEVCGALVEADRLEANPAAKTCKQHMA